MHGGVAGLLTGLVSRMTMGPDAISYLDMGDYFIKGEWSTALAADEVHSTRGYLNSHWRFLSPRHIGNIRSFTWCYSVSSFLLLVL